MKLLMPSMAIETCTCREVDKRQPTPFLAPIFPMKSCHHKNKGLDALASWMCGHVSINSHFAKKLTLHITLALAYVRHASACAQAVHGEGLPSGILFFSYILTAAADTSG